ncbi:MAG: mannose-1-phosphate guanylyltransferase [Bacteroidetes bacterium]|nr:mannose-1-phosphate guanylyltransferase [Bacteroidota bacterium]
MHNNYCVIMAGGIGSRFWPMSRQQHPKQFLDVLGTGKSLLQETYNRFKGLIPEENIFIVTNKTYENLVRKQLPEINSDRVLLEPSRRNTAPCIAYACHKIRMINPEARVIVAPSDHLILNTEVFLDKVSSGFSFVEKNRALLTLGIKPGRPDTGYGYIQFVPQSEGETDFRRVKTFTEKPNLELAKSFLASGEFLWNSGIFIAKVKDFIGAFSEHLPEVNNLFSDGEASYFTDGESDFIEKAYAQCTNISIDYGVMEKASNVYVLPSDFGWSDLGTWGSLYENFNKDSNENAIIGRNVMIQDASGCIVNVPKDKLVVIQGLKDFIVVESDGILLICKMEDEQEIRQLVTNVKVEKGEEYV